MSGYNGVKNYDQVKAGGNIKLAELCIVVAVVLAFSLASYARNLKWFDGYRMWTDVLEKSESKWRPYYRMGIILYQGGRYELALAQLARAYELKPDASGLLNNMGLAYQRMGRYDEAVDSYLYAIETGDSVFQANLNIGTIYLNKGNFSQALIFFNRSIELEPQNVVPLVNAGFAYADLGNFKEAIRLHTKAAAFDPYYANARYGLAIAREGSGDLVGAIREWERYVELAPKGSPWRQRALVEIKRLESINAGTR